MNASSTRLKNSFKILSIIMENEVSRADIARETGLTKTTVGSIVKNFLNLGFVREKKFIFSGIGRPSILLEIIPQSIYAMGIGIERHRVTGCVIDAQGHLVDQKWCSFKKNDGDSVMTAFFRVSDDLLKSASEKDIDVKAMVIATPGPLDITNGVIKNPPKFVNFKDVPIAKIAYKRYKMNVWLENDVDMVALGEKWYGDGRKLRDFVYVQVNEGIGAGIIMDGELYHGKEGYGGEIGHFLISKNGKYGYLEDFYGVDVIVERARKEISKDISDLGDVAELLKSNSKKAEKLVKETSQGIGAAILSLIHTLGISNIFIGGKIRIFDKFFLSNVQSIVNKYIFSSSSVNIRFSNVMETASAMGAAVQGVRKQLEKMVREKDLLRNSQKTNNDFI